jgi:endoglycosylceramidase
MRRHRALANVIGFAVAAACGSSRSPTLAPPDAAPRFPVHRTGPDDVHVVGRTLRDGQGRQLLFRGYNAKAKTLFDVTFPDGATPNETFYDFDERAATRFEQLGFNVLRLPVSWSGLEPHPHEYSEAFFSKIQAVLDLAAEHHFYVFIDMHQDAYSKWIGEDGEPLWAITPPPTMILHGPSTDARRTTPQVLEAGYSFFEDRKAQDGRALQAAYVEAVQEVVRRVAGNPVVLGYEAFNEPVVLIQSELEAFHARFAAGLHAIDADAPVLFEPIALRNETDAAYVSPTPWVNGPGIYAPHIYTAIFSVPSQNDWASKNPAVLAPSMAAAHHEASAWATPLFVTEFGCDQSMARGPLWIAAELDLQDEYLASSTVWEFSGRGSWGFYSEGYDEHAETAKTVSRTFPRAIAGDLVAIERPAPGHMLVKWRQTPATRGLPHEVSMSSDYATGYRVLCDGSEVKLTAATGRATFTCPARAGDRTFEVIGTPVP